MENTFKNSHGTRSSRSSGVGTMRSEQMSRMSGMSSGDTSSIQSNNVRFWDTCEMCEYHDADNAQSSCMIYSIRFMKLVAYIVLFTLLLMSAFAQKVTLLSLASIEKGGGMPDISNLTRRLRLCCGMSIPYLLKIVTGLWRIVFGKTDRPKPIHVLVVFIEMLHTGGLAILVFWLLPNIDIVPGLLILSALCLLPSALNVTLCKCSKENDSTLKTKVFCGIDVIILILQFGLIPYIFFVVEYLQDKPEKKISWYVLCVVASSLSCWENYSKDIKFLSEMAISDRQRPCLSVVSSLLSILLLFLMSVIVTDEGISIQFHAVGNAIKQMGSEDMLQNKLFLSFAIAPFVGHVAAYTACKLHMQIVSFVFPLLISTPTVLIYIFLKNEVDLGNSVIDVPLKTEWDFETFKWHLYPLSCVFSIYWIGRQVWAPKQKRLAKVEAVLFEQQLVLNRRKNEDVLQDKTDRDESTNKAHKSSENIEAPPNRPKEDKPVKPNSEQPLIYACATLWHETATEMSQLLKSLFTMDTDYYTRTKANTDKNIKDHVETYEFESHILFDDAFEYDQEERRVPNRFVKQFVELVKTTASNTLGGKIYMDDPIKIVTPYGGQLVFVMPGKSLLYVHLKDRNLIRHRKRWSQVMYMYYLLGFRLGLSAEIDAKDGKLETIARMMTQKATNTYILALDGDVDFTPDAVRMLLDKMKKDPKVGATCGRIYPIGNGPMIWYQKFEYAVAHWLQKSTEHILGCVLCSPGCFSLFRGSALMDDNVMRKYAILPTEAVHHLMYDQGEDRWLCTLLLKQGYRVEYVAAADAYTYAPEGFDEFFKQRRRWMPSTMANILDLLQDAGSTVRKNDNISRIYIIYQGTLMFSTVIGPATVLMMIAGAILTVFQVDLIQSYMIACIPVVVYFFMCFWVPQDFQLSMAKLLSTFYILIMTVVLVGCVVTAVEENPFHPSVVFLAGLIFIFAFAAVLHPRDIGCLLYGALYFIGLPMGFLLLVIYSLCNLQEVSWGTREVASVNKTKKQLEEEAEVARQNQIQKNDGFFAKLFPNAHFQQILKFMDEWKKNKTRTDDTLKVIQEVNTKFDKLMDIFRKQNFLQEHGSSENIADTVDKGVNTSDDRGEHVVPQNNYEQNPCWTSLTWLGNDSPVQLEFQENAFWDEFIKTYLQPLDQNKRLQDETRLKLIDLRNGVCGGIAIINVVWIAVNFMFQLRGPGLVSIPIPSLSESEGLSYLEVDVLGLSFVLFFLIILLIQFIGMVLHRWGTLLHLLAFTEIPTPWGTSLKDKRNELLKEYKAAFTGIDDEEESGNDTKINSKSKRKILKKVVKYIQTKGSKPPQDEIVEDIEETVEIYRKRKETIHTSNLRRRNQRQTSNFATTEYYNRKTVRQIRHRRRPNLEIPTPDYENDDESLEIPSELDRRFRRNFPRYH